MEGLSKKKIEIVIGKYIVYSDRHNYILGELKSGAAPPFNYKVDIKAGTYSFFPTLPMLFNHLLQRRLKESDISNFQELEESIIRMRELLDTPFRATEATQELV